MVTLGFTVLFAVTLLIGAIFGLVRGMNKALIRLMTLVLAVILTFAIAGPITTTLIQNVRIDGQTVGDMLMAALGTEGVLADIMETVPMLREAILAVPAFVLAIVVFPVVFAVLKFVTWIIYLFVQKPLRKLIFREDLSKKAKKSAQEVKPAEEEAPAEVAAEEATAEEATAEEAEAPAEAEVAAEVAEEKPAAVEPLPEKPAKASNKPSMKVRVAKRFAGMAAGMVTAAMIFGMMTTPLMGLFGILPAADTVSDTLGTLVEQGMISASDAELIRDAYGTTDSGVIAFYNIFGGKAAGKAYLSSASKIQAGGQTSSVANELSALLSAVQTAMGSGALKLLENAEDPAALYALLADKAFVDSLMQSLFQSKLLVTAVPELLASAMEGVATSMNVPANKEAVYDNMMDNVAQAVKNSGIDFEGMKAYEDAHSIVFSFARSGGAQQPAAREGIMTEAEYEAQVEELVKLAAQISSILNKAISGDNVAFTDTVADHIVNEVKAQAGENGQAALENFDATGVQNAISTVDTSAVQGDNAQQLLEQLTDKEKFETDVATVETITEAIKQTVAAAVADEDKAAETASTLANVVSNLAEVVSSATAEDGSIDMTKMDFTKLGDAITELQNSNLKGVGSSLLDVVVSGDLGGDAMVSGVLGAIKEGYENGEDIGGTISSAGALINMGSALGGNESNPETLVNSMTSLIENLNEFTISLLPTILSDDVIASMGIPQEQAEAAYGIIETLLKELMKLKGSEDYTQEVDSILALYNVLTTGFEEFNEESVVELLGYAKKSDALFNTLVSISDDNPFGIEYPTEADRESVAQSLREIYDMSEKTQKDKEIVNALGALLGAGALNLG